MDDWLDRQIRLDNVAGVDPEFPLIYTNHFVSRNPNHPKENPKIIGNFARLNDLSKEFSFMGPSAQRLQLGRRHSHSKQKSISKMGIIMSD